jgi:methylated-DNA-[protein]-cysteine S-methyltransferase
MQNLAQQLMPDHSARISVLRVASPLGDVVVAGADSGVCALAFDDRVEALEPRLRRAFGHFFHVASGDPLDVAARLGAYFRGDLEALVDVPLAVTPTPMQRRVWDLVRALRPGQLTTYAAIAERIGMPRAQRAVGVCLASNPLPLFIPCHRVVAASGGMGSHPGGLLRKRWLLSHEGVLDAQKLGIARHVRRRLDARDRSLAERGDLVVVEAT